mmetsp:Transcript_69124/g.205693  ORF Transcript_69124/g.205693 Transcript_69124/m.205693 type:complete len:222 (-) Transcript_69124:621-1286(-)
MDWPTEPSSTPALREAQAGTPAGDPRRLTSPGSAHAARVSACNSGGGLVFAAALAALVFARRTALAAAAETTASFGGGAAPAAASAAFTAGNAEGCCGTLGLLLASRSSREGRAASRAGSPAAFVGPFQAPAAGREGPAASSAFLDSEPPPRHCPEAEAAARCGTAWQPAPSEAVRWSSQPCTETMVPPPRVDAPLHLGSGSMRQQLCRQPGALAELFKAC